MSSNTNNTEHTGHKGKCRKTGFYGCRVVAKAYSRKTRCKYDKKRIDEFMKEFFQWVP